MDSLSGLLAFVRAAETHSFVAAGERLELSASAVGKSVARLEKRLGVRLFSRSTRRISLTEEGALFYERCRRIVDELEEAETELARLTDAPKGKLRVSLPAVGHRFLFPVLREFMRRYPDVELDLDFNDRLVDIIGEGVDAVIRSGDLTDSRLKARPLGSFRFVLVASPDYFSAHRSPRVPEELQQHACLRYKFPTSGLPQPWVIDAELRGESLKIPTTLTLNSVEALIAAAIDGLGIAYLPDFAVREPLVHGQLVSVLDEFLTDGGKFYVLWPCSRHLLPKLRVFIDFLADQAVLAP
jgi:DNA-binding transcriptional LysR family regulator